jgi:hypothetical protein
MSQEPPPDTPGPLAYPRQELRTPRAAGVAGLVFAVLLVASLLLLRTRVPAGATPPEIVAAFRRRAAGSLVLIGLYLVPFTGIAFLWFIAVVRNRIGDREDRFFSTVFQGSGLLFIAMLFAAAAVAGSLVAAVRFQGAPAPTAAEILASRALSYSLLFVYAVRMAGVFMVVTSTITYRTAALPRWISIVGYAIALVLLLSLRFFDLVLLLFPAWVALVSVAILVLDARAARAGRGDGTGV